MKKLFLLALSILGSYGFADELLLSVEKGDYIFVSIDKNMSTLEGTVLEQNKDNILLKTDDDQEVNIVKSSIAKISKGKPYSKNYPSFGITYGSPAFVNIFAQYTFDYLALRVSGMYFEPLKGIQFDAGYVLGQSRFSETAISAIVGYIYDISATTYAGVSAHIIVGVFYGELDAIYQFEQNVPAIIGQIGLSFMLK